MPTTIDDYLASLPDDRRAALSAIRQTINANLPAGYEEGLQYGMISWYVPLSRYPDTYNKQALCLAGLASQKHHMAMYLMTVYGHADTAAWFKQAYAKAGKKLDMGKSCVRFDRIDDVPLDVIGELIGKVSVDRYIEYTKSVRSKTKTAKRTRAKPAKKSAAKPAKKSPKATTRARPAKTSAKAAARSKRATKSTKKPASRMR